ncbi:zinc-dependent metalloprotease [Vulgatibacter sp.]|uniref:zinc-dependent metalloprotease n=1 Tax=Vulgatibacter sp. TaxID=1971226 RepID=UPI0035617BBF
MKFSWTRRLLPMLGAVTLAACADGAGDINRVQPNYQEKSQFQGDWYFRQTAIDVPYEAGWIFEGLASDIEKIHWEIQESALVAYRKNHLVPGAEQPGDTEDPEFVPVAAWAITSHFDIVRDYNPATGEQTNVIVENTTDRPWYQRDYIRVDWSKNILPSAMGLDTYITTAFVTGADYYVQEHEYDNPDRFELGEAYIGVVGKYHVEPDYRSCYAMFNDMWGTGSGYNCGAATIKVRSSFVKVDPDKPAYEPLNYPDMVPLVGTTDVNGDGKVDGDDAVKKTVSICSGVTVQNNQGSCTSYTEIACNQDVIDALNRDPFYEQFGYTYDDCRPAGEEMFGKFGYFRTERITYDRQWGHTESGRLNFANRWNIWKTSYDANGQPIPYAQREVKPIVYYLNPDFPEDLYGAADEIGRQWNEAFQRTVAALQGKEITEVSDVFVVKRNSCSPENLRAFVAGNRDAAKIADDVIGGMGRLDFENQERLCAALEAKLGFTWQKNGDLRYSFIYWVDRPQLAGPLGFGPSYADPDTGELLNGTAYVYGAGVDTYANSATEIVELLAGRITEDEVMDGDNMRRFVAANLERSREAREQHFPQEFFDRMNEKAAIFDRMPQGRLVPIPADHYDARLDRIKGTSWEREIFMDDDLLAAYVPGWRPGMELSEEELSKYSPASLFSKKAKDQREARIARFTSKHCALMADFVDASIIGLAMEYDAAGKTRDEIYRDLREKIFVGVMLHEVGHTVGLRHNFNGSTDALNYDDDYWRYATLPSDPAQARSLVDAEEVARIDACLAKAQEWSIGVSTLECLRGSELKQASIMDYGAKFNSDFLGLGKYDKAAIAFGYGQLVEVFEDDVEVPPFLASTLFLNDYTKIPEILGTTENIARRKLAPWSELVRSEADAMRHRAQNLPVFDSQLRCTANCDYAQSREVPYKFCSDEFAAWSLDCKRWDEGANQQEIVQSAIDSFRNYYPFWAFKRDRFNWNPNGYLNRISSRVFDHYTVAFQYYFFYGAYYGNTDFGRDLAAAAVNGLNHLAEVIQTPEPGRHVYCPSNNTYQPAYYGSEDPQGRPCGNSIKRPVDVPFGEGRPFWLEFTDDYHYTFKRIGAYYEKMIALGALADSQARFYRVDSADSSNYSINYYRIFKDEMLGLMGGIILDDHKRFGGKVRDLGGNKLAYEPAKVIDPATWGLPRTGSDETPVLVPRMTYQLRWYAALYGMAFLNSTVDNTMDFRNYFKVSLKGSQDDIDFGPIDYGDPDVYVEVTDPNTHYTYRAANTVDGNGFGYELVKAAKARHDEAWVPAKIALDEAANALQAAPDDDELRGAYYDALNEFRYEEQMLNDKLEFINDFRLFQSVFEYGG